MFWNKFVEANVSDESRKEDLLWHEAPERKAFAVAKFEKSVENFRKAMQISDSEPLEETAEEVESYKEILKDDI